MLLLKGLQGKGAPQPYKALLGLKARETRRCYQRAGQPQADTARCQKLLRHRRAGVLLSEKTSISRKHSKICFKTPKHLLDSLQGFPSAQQGICDQQTSVDSFDTHSLYKLDNTFTGGA